MADQPAEQGDVSSMCQEEIHQSLFDHMSEGFFVGRLVHMDGKPTDYRIVMANRAFERVVGLKASEVTRATRQQILLSISLDVLQRVVYTGEPRQDSSYLAERQRHLSVTVYRPFDGHFACLMQDITQQMADREALRQNERQVQLAQEVSPDGFTIFRPVRDADGRVVDFEWVYENAAIARLNGTDPEAVVGKRLLEVLPCRLNTTCLETYIRVATTRKPEVIEAPLLGEMVGRETWVRIAVVASGEDIAIWTQDITERKRAERELERTAAELKRSNEALEAFAYAAGHDLQEPLRMVTSFAQLLELRSRPGLDATSLEYLAFIQEHASRMSRLVDDLLAYARAGVKGEVSGPVDLADALEFAKTNLCTAIEESSAIVTHDALPTVLADARPMRQVFQNLLGNAIKFRALGRRPEIHVSARDAGEFWEIRVKDNGIGIEARDIGRLFQVFQRLHTQEDHPGSGLGLAICKKIIELQGGRIRVESEPGKGTTFIFTLPACRPATHL